MKKWIAGVFILLSILIVSLYIFIPSKINVRQSSAFAANRDGLYRNVFEQLAWNKWWPGTSDSAGHKFTYHGYTYTIRDKQLSSLVMTITNSRHDYSSLLTIVAPGPDSVMLDWEGSLNNSSNPFNRIKIYNESKQLRKEMGEIMDSISRFFSNNKNIYGYDIQKASVVDSNLVFTSRNLKSYPTTSLIYQMVDELRLFIKSKAANETGYPMLNVLTRDSIDYLVRVAIPVDRKMESSGNISYRWMLGGGNILITEVKGGIHEINKAFEQVEHYVADHQRIAPAIPFFSLVTDRRTEPDSTKWITRIYYPVM